MKHTPGPWKFIRLKDYECYSIYVGESRQTDDTTDNTVAGVWDVTETGEANAKLISSAPDLLEALENILKGRRKGDKERFYWLEVDIEDDIAAEDAIKKARGL